MKKQLVFSVVLGALLSVMTISTASAQEFVPQHELRLSVGCVPINYNYFMKYDCIGNPLLRHGAVYTAGVWSLSYGYRFNKWFDLSVAVSYYGEYSAVYSNIDNSKLHPDNMHAISILPVARFTWLNRKWVRMYSSLALGALIEVEQGSRTYTEGYVGGQLTPIGITVGRSLFGFAEIGLGTQGLATIGLGYRFNDKKR